VFFYACFRSGIGRGETIDNCPSRQFRILTGRGEHPESHKAPFGDQRFHQRYRAETLRLDLMPIRNNRSSLI
jgi:hypothetical protein